MDMIGRIRRLHSRKNKSERETPPIAFMPSPAVQMDEANAVVSASCPAQKDVDARYLRDPAAPGCNVPTRAAEAAATEPR